MDLEIRKMKKNIVSALNESAVPMEVKRLVLAELLRDVSALADQVVAEQEKSEDEENGN